MPFGYLGTTPNQQLKNSGVFSVEEVLAVENNGEWGGSLKLIQSQSVSGATTCNFTSIQQEKYDVHLLQLDDMESGSTAYRISKTALNALTKILSNELSPLGIKVNTICPGWVQTDMGGANATLTIEESTTRIVNFALKDNFPTGQFLRHGEIIPW